MTDHVKAAAQAHTNLTMFYAIIELCEGGLFTGDRAGDAQRKIITICRQASSAQLRLYDQARAALHPQGASHDRT